MGATITQRQLRNDSGAVLRAVEAGETYVVTRGGHPVAELRPLGRRTLVPRARLVAAAQALPPIDPHRFRADIDAALDQDIDPVRGDAGSDD